MRSNLTGELFVSEQQRIYDKICWIYPRSWSGTEFALLYELRRLGVLWYDGKVADERVPSDFTTCPYILLSFNRKSSCLSFNQGVDRDELKREFMEFREKENIYFAEYSFIFARTIEFNLGLSVRELPTIKMEEI